MSLTPTFTSPTHELDYKQVNDFRWKQISPNGVCIALSIYWVIKNAKGENYLQWLDPPSAASSKGRAYQPGQESETVKKTNQQIAVLMKKQEQHNKAISDQCISADISFMEWAEMKIVKHQGYGNTDLTLDGDMVTLEQKTWYEIAREVTTKDGYVLFSWRFTSGGGHVCAAHITAPTIVFFDPNYGEYKFQDRYSFRKWFRDVLMTNTYYPGSGSICARSRVLHFK
ncbi:MAG: YopT-type cysteine protease domain-containing protein [Caldilineaceae bacterium]